MNVVVVGGTGRIGSKVVERLNANGHHATPAAPKTGVNALTNERVEETVSGAEVLVDASDAPVTDGQEVVDFFTGVSRNLVAAGKAAGVAHYVVVSTVATGRLPDSRYLRAKADQEKIVSDSGIPFTIVRATEFYEFLPVLADAATVDGTVHLAPVQFQPMAAADVAAAVCRASVGTAVNGVQEVGGPERRRMDEMINAVLLDEGDWREVVVDEHATYFGSELSDDSLLPGPGALLSTTTYADWAASR